MFLHKDLEPAPGGRFHCKELVCLLILLASFVISGRSWLRVLERVRDWFEKR